jgi:hypothetical protein
MKFAAAPAIGRAAWSGSTVTLIHSDKVVSRIANPRALR